MSTQNYEVLFVERGVADLRECEMPSAGPGELLIRATVSLISSGTERAFLLGLANTSDKYPQRTGYSHIGEVVEVGAGVEGWKVGDRVASRANHKLFASMPVASCNHVPNALTNERAAFFRLTSIAMQGVRKARIELGEPVAVIGCGPVGLLAAQLARLSGGLPVVSIDKDGRRLEFTAALGIDVALPADDEIKAALRTQCGEQDPALVVDATGHPEAIPAAFDLARFGGRVVLLASTRGDTEAVNFYRDVHKKGLTVIGAHESTRPRLDSAPGWWTHQADENTALRLLAGERLVVDPITTHRFDWRNAAVAYEMLARWEPGMMGTLLDWQDS
ncbi:MAG: zinc-binding alcohol dehydrogenase [Caldilineaceae bacterium]|nr:zinc-binding alcohol dehydrogenase [Caldilineaceae bacterium]